MIVVIAILFAVLISRVDFAGDRAKRTGAMTDLHAYQTAIIAAAQEYGIDHDVEDFVKAVNISLDSELKLSVEGEDMVSGISNTGAYYWGTMSNASYHANAVVVTINGEDIMVYTQTSLSKLSTNSDSTAANASITIGRCTVGSDTEGMICQKLKDMFGANSTIQFSATETDTCKYSTSVTLSDGKVTNVYLSQKPTSGDVDISIDDAGNITVGGNSIEDVLLANYGKNHNVKYRSYDGRSSYAYDDAYPYYTKLIYTDGTERYVWLSELPIASDTMESAAALIDRNTTDLSDYEQEILSYWPDLSFVSYTLEETGPYKYKGVFKVNGKNHELWFLQFPSELVSAIPSQKYDDKCASLGFPKSTVCYQLVAAFGPESQNRYSLSKNAFCQHPVVVDVNGEALVVYLREPANEYQIAYLRGSLSDKDAKRALDNGISAWVVVLIVLCVLAVGLISTLLVLRKSKSRKP